MYTPPFKVTDEMMSLLISICSQSPQADNKVEIPAWSIDSISCSYGVGLRMCGEHPHWAPVLLDSLLDWIRNSSCHLLIRCAVFYYEFIQICPFSENNRMIAQQLRDSILSQWDAALGGNGINIPESELNTALESADATQVIVLTLQAIKKAVTVKSVTHKSPKRRISPVEQLLNHIRKHPGSKRNDLLTALPSLSARMLDRHLLALKEEGAIEYQGSRKTGAYYPAATR